MNSTAILTALDLSIALMSRAQQISAMIKSAQAEGRDLTSAELESLRTADDAAMQALSDAIDKAKAEGR